MEAVNSDEAEAVSERRLRVRRSAEFTAEMRQRARKLYTP